MMEVSRESIRELGEDGEHCREGKKMCQRRSPSGAAQGRGEEVRRAPRT